MSITPRVPRWILAGSFLLPAIGGFMNTVSFLGFTHTAVSHMTGTLTTGIIATSSGLWETAGTAGLLLVSFMGGAVLSGLIVGNERLVFGRRYGYALLAEGAIILTSYGLFSRQQIAGEFFAAAACGLQNSMVATYSGAVVRSTHVTGLLSDLGSLLGQALMKRRIEVWRVKMLVTILCGFSSGGFAGVVLFSRIGFHALLAPAGTVLAAGSSYLVYRRAVQRTTRELPIFSIPLD